MTIEQAKAECRKCKRYDEKNRICRKWNQVKPPDGECPGFEMQLADHFVPNIWDEWKRKKEKGSL